MKYDVLIINQGWFGEMMPYKVIVTSDEHQEVDYTMTRRGAKRAALKLIRSIERKETMPKIVASYEVET